MVRWLALSSALVVLAAAQPSAAATETATDAAAAQKVPAAKVMAMKVSNVAFSLGKTYTGRVESIEAVKLMAKVQGYLKRKSFKEGDVVKEGSPLFELEQDVYQLAVQQAEAQLQSAKAQQVLAKQQFDRQVQLTERNVQSQASLDAAQATLDSAQAAVSAADVGLSQAKLNLSYTTITAPISGRIGRSDVSIGALISPQSGPLVTLVQVDPIYITFAVPQADMLEVQKRKAAKDDLTIQVVLADGTTYSQTGTLDYIDVQAVSSTDSVVVRATFPNPKDVLIDKGLVNVVIAAKVKQEQLAVPQQSLLLDQQGSYVMVVDSNNNAEQVHITTGRQQNGLIEVTQGLKAGDMVIVEGLQNVRPGGPVEVSQWNPPGQAADQPQTEQSN